MITVVDLHYTYPDGRQALQGASFEIETGTRVALLGANGAGKTTLALHLNGIYRPDSGSVEIGELAVTEDNLTEIRRRVGLVFQDPNDQLFMPTVAEDVAFGPANLGVTGEKLDQVVAEALDTVQAGHLKDRAPHHLSGGEKRRVAIATVLSMEPDVLVLDEPGAGLDPAGRRELIETLGSINMTQLIITHDLLLAAELCDHSVIMAEGEVVATGPTQQLLADAELLASYRLELPRLPA